MEYPCPVQSATWQAFDILGNQITNSTAFYNLRFTNDELRLTNFRTYFTTVEVTDVINRTWYGKSDGVMTVIEPPNLGTVRDGPYVGEDRDYQESTQVLAFNWDAFGDVEDPLQEIIRYEVAIGDSPAYASTRTNVHYFVDVGLNLTYTFYHLSLAEKTVEYYGTVRAHSISGAYADGVSNGIRAGYQQGMISGHVTVAPYTHNNTWLSLYWSGFVSDFSMRHYRWGIGLSYFGNDNVTISCADLRPLFNDWAGVQAPIDEGRDTYGEHGGLNLEHGHVYYVTVMAEDEAGQCTSAPTQRFKVDMTPPELGVIRLDGISKRAQYTTSDQELTVRLAGFRDPESDVKSFTIQLLQQGACDVDSDADSWSPLTDAIDVKNTTVYTFRQLALQADVAYRLKIQAVNGAGLLAQEFSEALFVDTTAPTEGECTYTCLCTPTCVYMYVRVP